MYYEEAYKDAYDKLNKATLEIGKLRYQIHFLLEEIKRINEADDKTAKAIASVIVKDCADWNELTK